MPEFTINPVVPSAHLIDTNDCPACGHGLDGLPVAARFCPACGAIVRIPQMIFDSWLGKLFGMARHRPQFLIRDGYASAMLHLGWRYESGLGSMKNPAEALRCYCKSAKLGNQAALARIMAKGVLPIKDKSV